MNKRLVSSTFLGSALLFTVLGSPAMAQGVQRTFVSGSGSDGNPCSRAAPCRTFGQAISQTSPGGEVIALDSAGYGAFTITQPVTVQAAPGVYAGISVFSGDGIDINAGSSDTVILRGLTVNAQGGTNGIVQIAGGSLHIENCVVNGFTSGDGARMLSGGNLFITGTDVRACATGVHLETNGATPARLVGHSSRFTECGTGVFLGISASATSTATGLLSDCMASLCTGSGFVAATIAMAALIARLDLTNCRAFGNSIGLQTIVSGGGIATIFIVGCTVIDNTADTQNGNGFIEGTTPATNLTRGSTKGSFPLQ